MNLAKREGILVKVFLTADGAFCARKGQTTPDGFYNIERMLKYLTTKVKAAT